MSQSSDLERIAVPVIDLFAGPGGLGEGFSSVRDINGDRCFRIALSIEKDLYAHRTLELRALFRAFGDSVPEDYYRYLKGKISREELFERHLKEAEIAANQAWLAELGNTRFPADVVDEKIRKALGKENLWVLIGGPPCQAYSIVGRSRMRNTDPERFEMDPRHLLYREYLHILAVHTPPVFIMENVRGILSAKLNGDNIFTRILTDLQNPVNNLTESEKLISHNNKASYRIYSLCQPSWHLSNPAAFVIKMKSYGVPQDRQRVIILGVREDLSVIPDLLEKSDNIISLQQVIGDLPKLRSRLTTPDDSASAWAEVIKEIPESSWFATDNIDTGVKYEILSYVSRISSSLSTGESFTRSYRRPKYLPEWFLDKNMRGVSNHLSRSHMKTDIQRYFFASCFAKVHGRSPLLRDFPESLLPEHRNVRNAISGKGLFSDRFRVQLKDTPATTVTSHIAKDGHYFIHYDPRQCRSLTVREAARIQTFPDNYYFEGPQTSQYQQVGNAVPPLLARSIARVVWNLLQKTRVDSDAPYAKNYLQVKVL